MSGLRFVLLQAVLACGLATLWFTGILPQVIAGESRWFCGAVWAVGLIGLGCVGFRRYSDADWIADNLVVLAVIGMQIGISAGIVVLAKASDTAAAVQPFLSTVGIAFQVSISALASHSWLKLNVRLLGGGYGR